LRAVGLSAAVARSRERKACVQLIFEGDERMSKEKIKPIYTELQGYLSQSKSIEKMLGDENLWEQVNNAIGELNRISGEDYSRFKMRPEKGGSGRYYLYADTYRTNLGGLIARLYGQYFADEQAPFGDMPSTVISQTQQQNQSVQVQMLLDFHSKIDEKLNELEPGDKKKRKFLETVKNALGSVKDYAGLLALYLTTARELGLSLEEILELIR